MREGRKEEDREENVEGLVRKSKGFLPINLSNPKGDFFDAKRICLKEKLAGDFLEVLL